MKLRHVKVLHRTSSCNAVSTRRQKSLVSFFRDRCEIGTDQRPSLAIVIAAKQLAAGGAAEDRALVIGFFQAESAELMLQACR